MEPTKPYLVLGIGNLLLKDEGVGVHVIRAIEARVAAGDLALPEGVEVCDGGTLGMDLLDLIEDRRKVIVVDAVEADAAPATVWRFTAEDLARLRQGEAPLRRGEARREAADLSLHQLGLFEMLAMARRLGRTPDVVVIFGIVPKDMSPGLELSAEVAAVVPEVIRRVLLEM
jgi:hydrogenase maturation protease